MGIGESAINAIIGGGNLLDLPSSVLRDVLSSRNPFDQLLDPANWFQSKNRATGRDLLRNWGAMGEEDTWGNFAGGMATEMALDPFNLVSGGALGAALGAVKGLKALRPAARGGRYLEDTLAAAAKASAGAPKGAMGAMPRNALEEALVYGPFETTPKYARYLEPTEETPFFSLGQKKVEEIFGKRHEMSTGEVRKLLREQTSGLPPVKKEELGLAKMEELLDTLEWTRTDPEVRRHLPAQPWHSSGGDDLVSERFSTLKEAEQFAEDQPWDRSRAKIKEDADGFRVSYPRGVPVNKEELMARFGKVHEENLPEVTELSGDIDSITTRYEAKYPGYVTPGGEGYKEFVSVLPEAEIYRALDLPTGPKSIRGARGYESPHWPIPDPDEFPYFGGQDVLSHSRVTVRKTPDGKKTLHLEETQHDWHKDVIEGKSRLREEMNWKVEDDSTWLADTSDGLYQIVKEHPHGKGNPGVFRVRDPWGGVLATRDTLEVAKDFASRHLKKNIAQETGLPLTPEGEIWQPPFAGNWQEKEIKKLIHYAAKNNIDSISVDSADNLFIKNRVGDLNSIRLIEEVTDKLGIRIDDTEKFKRGVISLAHEIEAYPASNLNEATTSIGKALQDRGSWRQGEGPQRGTPGRAAARRRDELLDYRPGDALYVPEILRRAKTLTGLRVNYDRKLPDMLEKLAKKHGIEIRKEPFKTAKARDWVHEGSWEGGGFHYHKQLSELGVEPSPEQVAEFMGIPGVAGPAPAWFTRPGSIGAGFLGAEGLLGKMIKGGTPEELSDISARYIKEGLRPPFMQTPTIDVGPNLVEQALKKGWPLFALPPAVGYGLSKGYGPGQPGQEGPIQ